VVVEVEKVVELDMVLVVEEEGVAVGGMVLEVIMVLGMEVEKVVVLGVDMVLVESMVEAMEVGVEAVEVVEAAMLLEGHTEADMVEEKVVVMVVVQRVAMLVVVAAALEVVAVVVMVLVVSMELGTEAVEAKVEATVLVAMLLENATRYYTNLKKNLPIRCGARNKSNLVKNMLIISTII
jgi:hypothetical protein